MEAVTATVAWTRVPELDIDSYHRWAAGNLVDNRNRGVFAEWLAGQALGAIDNDAHRIEWDAWDLNYRCKGIEVKASGLSQSWNPHVPSKRQGFNIAPPKRIWHAGTDSWETNDDGTRPADVYVFCLHESVPANNENVADPNRWRFWVISARTLDEQIGGQQTIGIATLNRLAKPILWTDIKPSVYALIPDRT